MINISKIRITDAQNILLQGVVSILGAALLASVTVAFQYVTQHGLVSVSTAVSVGLAAFLFTFGSALKAFVPSHITQEMQAYQDTIKQLQDALAHLTAVQAVPVSAAPAPLATSVGPLVVINHAPDASQQGIQRADMSQQGQGQSAYTGGPVQLDFPENPGRPVMPAHLQSLDTTQQGPQLAFPAPLTDDTLTGVQAASARQQRAS